MIPDLLLPGSLLIILRTDFRHLLPLSSNLHLGEVNVMQGDNLVNMQLVNLFETQDIGEIVRSDYRTARVFRDYGINYCCVGNVSLQEICGAMHLPYADVLRKLNQASQATNLPLDLQFHNWKIDFLIDYIVNIHHAYLRQTLPQLRTELLECHENHAHIYRHLETMLEIHSAVCLLMNTEFEHQENVLFPYIKQIYSAHRRREPYGKLFVRTLGKPLHKSNGVQQLLSEHLNALRELTGEYRVSDKECPAYKVLIKALHELDNQLVLHKHLENNILLPAAIDMERELLQT